MLEILSLRSYMVRLDHDTKSDIFSHYPCQFTDMPDVEKYFPGLVEATQDWFKIYKIPDGKPENKFAFEGKAQNRVSQKAAAESA